MLLLAALSGLLAIGVWLYCLVDILITSREGCRHMPKQAWLAVVALTFALGAAAWLLIGRSRAARPRRRRRMVTAYHWAEHDPRGAALARSRHPAGRARPIGPDDDPAFLHQLDQMIRRDYDAGNEA